MMRFLRFLGGRGTWVLFAGVFVGLGLPDLAALAHPLLTPCVVLLLRLAFLRVNWHEALSYARRPTLSLLVISWILLVCPFLVWLVLKATPLPEPLVTALVLMAAAPPILGSTALAIMLRLDAAHAARVQRGRARGSHPLRGLVPPVAVQRRSRVPLARILLCHGADHFEPERGLTRWG